MGTFANLDAEMQKDLLDFVKKQEEKPWPKPLGDSLLADVFKSIIKGPCSVTGWARKGNKVWMELTWDFDEKKSEKAPKAEKEPEPVKKVELEKAPETDKAPDAEADKAADQKEENISDEEIKKTLTTSEKKVRRAGRPKKSTEQILDEMARKRGEL